MSEGGWAAGSHDVVWIEGPDAISFADGQLSQDISVMRPGEVRRSLLLEPRGKLRAIPWVLAGEDAVGLLTWAGTGRSVAADLERFLFRVDALVSTDEAVASSRWGPGAAGFACRGSGRGIVSGRGWGCRRAGHPPTCSWDPSPPTRRCSPPG